MFGFICCQSAAAGATTERFVSPGADRHAWAVDPGVFIDGLRAEMRREMQALDDALDGDDLPWLEIAPRGRHGAIRLTPLEALPEPVNLDRLKKAIV